MTENKKVINEILNIFSKNNFKPYDVEFSSKYFIFDMGQDSIATFKVKRLWMGWKFGIWVDLKNKEKAVRVFAQHKDNIDKFKPSESKILEEFSLDDLKCNSFIEARLLGMLKSLQCKPFLCYNGLYCNGMENNCISYFIKRKFQIFYKNLVYIQYIYIAIAKIKIAFLKNKDCIEKINFYKSPFYGSFYNLDIYFKEENENSFLKYIDILFKKDEYGFPFWDTHAFEINYFMTKKDGKITRVTYISSKK